MIFILKRDNLFPPSRQVYAVYIGRIGSPSRADFAFLAGLPRLASCRRRRRAVALPDCPVPGRATAMLFLAAVAVPDVIAARAGDSQQIGPGVKLAGILQACPCNQLMGCWQANELEFRRIDDVRRQSPPEHKRPPTPPQNSSSRMEAILSLPSPARPSAQHTWQMAKGRVDLPRLAGRPRRPCFDSAKRAAVAGPVPPMLNSAEKRRLLAYFPDNSAGIPNMM